MSRWKRCAKSTWRARAARFWPRSGGPALVACDGPSHQLRSLAARQARLVAHSSVPGSRHPQARLFSNKTHYSLTDPDALNYLCSLAVDMAQGVISHVQADLADSRDSLHLPRLRTGLQRRLRANDLPLRELLADAGYANGANYALLETQHITAWIPVFGQYKAVIAGFTYDAPTDAYPCAAGKVLPFRKYDTAADGHWLKIYWATCSDCQQCPLKPTCVPGAKRKQLTRTLYDAPYRRAWQRQQSH